MISLCDGRKKRKEKRKVYLHVEKRGVDRRGFWSCDILKGMEGRSTSETPTVRGHTTVVKNGYNPFLVGIPSNL